MDDTNSLSVTGGDASAAPTDTGLTPVDGAAISSDGVGALQPASTQEPGAPAWESVIASIPDTDDDLTQPTFPHVEGLRTQRQQLRVLRDAVKELTAGQTDIQPYRELGSVAAIKPAVELANLLYSPLTDPRSGQPVIDQKTGTAYVTTAPFLSYLDENSPGMPEQLLVDLLDFEPTDESGNKTPKLSHQVLEYWGLDPARIKDYRNIDAIVATSGEAITAAELKDILPEFHQAYRNLLPSVRAAWPAYSEADQMVMLQREKAGLDRIATDKQRDERDRQRDEAEQAQYRALVAQEQRKYFAQVRSERFASIAEKLSAQVTFSADPTTNAVMHGAVGAVLANLIDLEFRFVTDGLIQALGIKFDHTYDAALNTFNSEANRKVALEMAGDIVQARQAEEKAATAANLLSTKLGIIALKVAKAMGGQQAAAATANGNALDTAAAARSLAGNGAAPNGQQTGVLPSHIRPGTPEAARYLANSTGFWRTN